MTSKGYWQERSRLNKLRVLHLGERFINELKKVLKGNLDDIDKEIKAFYDKYGDNPAEKLSYEEFQKYKANLIKKAKKYPKDKILQKQAKQDIPKYKIDRLRQLETEVQSLLNHDVLFRGLSLHVYSTFASLFAYIVFFLSEYRYGTIESEELSYLYKICKPFENTNLT